LIAKIDFDFIQLSGDDHFLPVEGKIICITVLLLLLLLPPHDTCVLNSPHHLATFSRQLRQLRLIFSACVGCASAAAQTSDLLGDVGAASPASSYRSPARF